MTKEEAVRQLNEIDSGDRELAHGIADGILLEFLAENGFKEISDAWDSACGRVGFWYA